MRLTVYINGEQTTVLADAGHPLETVLKAAGEQTQSARPWHIWEVRDEPGFLLSSARKLQDQHIVDGAVLYMTLPTGEGG